MEKKKRRWLIPVCIIAALILFLLTINLIPPTLAVQENPFLKKETQVTMIAAHRGGGANNPENTLKAYRAAVNDYRVDIIETDLWLTKDGRLVYNHDRTVNRTSDAAILFGDAEKEYAIGDLTLEELQNLNFGYHFQDAEGNYPYRSLAGLDGANRKQVLKENGLQIVEVTELFQEFYASHPELLFIVEIKNGGEQGFTAATVLDNALSAYPQYKQQLVVGTFHDEIQKDLEQNHPTLLTGASTGAAASFIITQLLKVNVFYQPTFACLQIPTSYNIKGITLTLDRKTILRQAHRRNIAVQYWTINDEQEMRHLIDLGCDAIMTDNPALLRNVVDSYPAKF